MPSLVGLAEIVQTCHIPYQTYCLIKFSYKLRFHIVKTAILSIFTRLVDAYYFEL